MISSLGVAKGFFFFKENFHQVRWLTAIIPANQQAEIGESQFEATPGKS
jgi:hypothetical protein